MTMRPMTVRMSERLVGLLNRAAEQEGVSAAQFIREAVIARLAFMHATADPAEVQSLQEALRELREEGSL